MPRSGLVALVLVAAITASFVLVSDSLALSDVTYVIETVDSGPTDVGHFISLALDAAENPHVSYLDIDNRRLKYARRENGAWVLEDVAAAGIGFGANTDIALDNDGNPHVTYFARTDSTVRYARRVSGFWAIETIERWAFGVTGPAASIALDEDGNPHVSYERRTGAAALAYATRSGSGWTIESVSPGGVGESVLSLDTDGNPHIVYDRGDRIRYVRRIEGHWIEEIATPPPDGGSIAPHVSFVLDRNRKPHVTYSRFYLGYANTLHYVRKGLGNWSRETIDPSTTEDTWFGSLALDASNHPHVSYFRSGERDLKYGRKVGPWITSVIDSTGSVGAYTSLALGQDNRPHIAYYDETSGDLKYARVVDAEANAAAVSLARGARDASVPLLVAYPNPSTGPIEIRYRASGERELDFAVYDTSGRRIRSLSAGKVPVGLQTTSWDRRDQAGNEVAAGVYFLRLEVGDGHRATERVTIVR
jgi:FlgD Ig-like domain